MITSDLSADNKQFIVRKGLENGMTCIDITCRDIPECNTLLEEMDRQWAARGSGPDYFAMWSTLGPMVTSVTAFANRLGYLSFVASLTHSPRMA